MTTINAIVNANAVIKWNGNNMDLNDSDFKFLQQQQNSKTKKYSDKLWK